MTGAFTFKYASIGAKVAEQVIAFHSFVLFDSHGFTNRIVRQSPECIVNLVL